MTFTDDAHHDEDWRQAWDNPDEIDPAKKKALLDSLHLKMDAGHSPSGTTRRLLFIGLPAAAAAAVLIFLFVRSVMAPIPVARWREIASANTMLRLTLDDSSTLFLAPHSAIRVYPKFSSQRKIDLTNGIAFFDVKKDDNHPFSVSAGPQLITVLGTAFSVQRLDSINIDLMVRDGKVALDVPNQTRRILLTAGMTVNTAAWQTTQVDPADTDWWLQQQVRWHNIALGDLLRKLGNYYRTKLTYDTIDKQMKVTLTWDMNLSLEENLGVLNSVTGYNIH
ncbi:FecR family protein [Puia sp. P3]|uniref:FecR family protein n=1 Tax=Puia sp. P3 TaxID=3423952 RepID=UPI003D672487